MGTPNNIQSHKISFKTAIDKQSLRQLLNETAHQLNDPGWLNLRILFGLAPHPHNSWDIRDGISFDSEHVNENIGEDDIFVEKVASCTRCKSPFEVRYVPSDRRPYVITLHDARNPGCEHLSDGTYDQLIIRCKIVSADGNPDNSGIDGPAGDPEEAQRLVEEFARAMVKTSKQMIGQ